MKIRLENVLRFFCEFVFCPVKCRHIRWEYVSYSDSLLEMANIELHK